MVERSYVYLGKVVKVNSIYESDNLVKPKLLTSERIVSYRSILFVPDVHNFSDDLLYEGPSYPVLNLTSDNTCLNLNKGSIVVEDACNLEILLRYFGFKENLTIEDIIKIRKTFFKPKFAINNCELFGWKKVSQKELPVLSKNYFVYKIGNRFFIRKTCGGELPLEYFDALIESKDSTLLFGEKRDAFEPHKDEGPVRRKLFYY